MIYRVFCTKISQFILSEDKIGTFCRKPVGEAVANIDARHRELVDLAHHRGLARSASVRTIRGEKRKFDLPPVCPGLDKTVRPYDRSEAHIAASEFTFEQSRYVELEAIADYVDRHVRFRAFS